jgi:hypothetical protein
MKKFEETRENVFNAIENYLKEILNECDGDSKSKSAQSIDASKV